MKESHPKLRNKKKGEKGEEEKKEGEEEKKKEEKIKPVRPKITSLMLCCFIFEFCNRWGMNAFDCRYGFFLKDKFNAPDNHFSYKNPYSLNNRIVVVISSIICCTLQLLVYPWLVSSLNIPVTYLACLGMFIQFLCFVGMSALPTELGSIIASLFMWVGFCLECPASVSIISVLSIYNCHCYK